MALRTPGLTAMARLLPDEPSGRRPRRAPHRPGAPVVVQRPADAPPPVRPDPPADRRRADRQAGCRDHVQRRRRRRLHRRPAPLAARPRRAPDVTRGRHGAGPRGRRQWTARRRPRRRSRSPPCRRTSPTPPSASPARTRPCAWPRNGTPPCRRRCSRTCRCSPRRPSPAMAGRLIDALPYRSFISPTVNLAITNVPGPRQRVHLAGRPLESSHPVMSINYLTPLHIGLQSGPDGVGRRCGGMSRDARRPRFPGGRRPSRAGRARRHRRSGPALAATDPPAVLRASARWRGTARSALR